MLVPAILSLFIGLSMKFGLAKNFNVFIVIHKLFFVIIAVGAYFHGAFWVWYLGIFSVLFEILIRIFFVLINRGKLKNPKFSLLGDHYIKVTF